MLPVAILAGGLGTRMRHRTGPDLPKALLMVAGCPFIDIKLRELRAAGVTRAIMLVGHGGEALVGHVGTGARFGLEVEHVHEPPLLLGTGGALRNALPRLGEAFFVTYGDTLLDVPMAQLERRLLSNQVLAVMTVLENHDQWETSNVDVKGEQVTAYEKAATTGTHRFLDYGMLAMRAAAFDGTSMTERFDLAAVIRPLVARREVLALTVERRFYDVGNEQSLLETEAHLRTLNLP